MKKLDQHFTPDEFATHIARSVVNRYDPCRVRRYIEPSAGGGAFVRALVDAGVSRGQITSIDLDPDLAPDLVGDFLAYQTPADLVIGNPPFGRNGATAHAFVRHALELAPVVVFVMPLSALRRPKTWGAALPKVRFPETDVKVALCEYHRGLLFSEPEAPPLPDGGLEFVGPSDPYDIVIQRCGMSPGRVTTCNGTGQGKYYIKAGPRIVRALRNLEPFLPFCPEVFLTSHQPSIDRQALLRLLHLSFFSEFASDET